MENGGEILQRRSSFIKQAHGGGGGLRRGGQEKIHRTFSKDEIRRSRCMEWVAEESLPLSPLLLRRSLGRKGQKTTGGERRRRRRKRLMIEDKRERGSCGGEQEEERCFCQKKVFVFLRDDKKFRTQKSFFEPSQLRCCLQDCGGIGGG